jgi:hypothetical protein
MSTVLDLKIPVWLYRVIAIFPATGMVGLDHYAVGSTQTAFAKGLVNLITFGSWYIYDILQSLDGPQIAEKGLRFPFYEGGSIGAGRLATDMTGLGKGGENLLNILFTSAAALLCGIAMIFENKPPPVGDLAKTAKTVFGGATVGLAGYTAYGAFKGAATLAAPLSAVAGIKMPAGVPSVDKLAKMVGGGADEPITKAVSGDFIALGLLFLFAASGFALSAIRSRGV